MKTFRTEKFKIFELFHTMNHETKQIAAEWSFFLIEKAVQHYTTMTINCDNFQ